MAAAVVEAPSYLFLRRAGAFFAPHGIASIERVMTDNAWAYRHSLGEICEQVEGPSSCLCKRRVPVWLEVAVDALGVDERQLLQSLLPVRGHLSLDEPAFGFTLL